MLHRVPMVTWPICRFRERSYLAFKKHMASNIAIMYRHRVVIQHTHTHKYDKEHAQTHSCYLAHTQSTCAIVTLQVIKTTGMSRQNTQGHTSLLSTLFIICHELWQNFSMLTARESASITYGRAVMEKNPYLTYTSSTSRHTIMSSTSRAELHSTHVCLEQLYKTNKSVYFK